MAEYIRDFVNFLGIEEENQIKSCVNLGEYSLLIMNLDTLYKQVLDVVIDKKEHKIPVFLYLNVHREFYLSMANFVRLHETKSFCNLRSAVDSAFTAYYLLKNHSKESIYLAKIKSEPEENGNKKEWNKIFKNIKATINKNIDEFPHARGLIEVHDFCSTFAHADAMGILSRYVENIENLTLESNYFDYKDSDDSYKKSLITILSSFLRIFSLFWAIFFEEKSPPEIQHTVKARALAYERKLNELGSNLYH